MADQLTIMAESTSYNADLVSKADQDSYWSALLMPDAERAAFLAICALNLELSRIGDQVNETQLGEIRLQWWRDALSAALREGQAEHPALKELVRVSRQFSFDEADLSGMVDAHAFDLYDEPMAEMSALDAYHQATFGAILRSGVTIAGGSSNDNLEACEWAARALGLTAVMHRLPFDAAKERVYLPLSLLGKHGIHPDVIRRGEINADIRAAIRDLGQEATSALTEFRLRAKAIPRYLRPVFAPVSLVAPMLDVLAKPSHDPLRVAIQLNPMRRYLLIWRAFLIGRF